jgi:hypothetical protein
MTIRIFIKGMLSSNFQAIIAEKNKNPKKAQIEFDK